MAKTKDSKYGVNGRQQMEANETSKTVETGLPGERYSTKVQATDSMETITPASSVAGSGLTKDIAATKLTEAARKVKVHPTSNDKLLDNTQVGGVPIGSGQAVTMSAAGAYGNVSTVEDSSKIPYTVGGYRPDSRQAKKTSDNDFIINNAISEQIEPEFEGTKDLRKAPNALQGYNGQKQFKTARGKKNAGEVPQATLFDRSVDFHKIDATVHTTGQVLSNIEDKAGYPTITAKANLELGDAGYEQIANPMKKSNYLLKSLSFTLTNGKLSAVSFNEDEIPADVHAQETYQANQNWQLDRNNVAKTMIRLQKELGRETTDKWSPLGYVLKQPYEYNMVAHDIEAVTGAMQLLAYRAANSSLAFQSSNKIAKDGAKPLTPVLEMFLDGIGQLSNSIDDSAIVNTDMNSVVFSNEFCKLGSASAIIKMFDSTSKYTTKANFFNLPRSLKYFVQTMDNNINPLRCKKEFLMAVDTAHVYSTFDGSYNPMLPITATDKISIINPMSLNYFLKGWNRDNANSENLSGTAALYTYKYGDIRNVYSWNIKHPIVEGLLNWMIKHEPALVKAYGANATVTLPCFFSMLAPSMFQSMLCAASQEILWARNIFFRDFLFAGDQTEYIWKDLSPLSELNPKYSSNFTLTDFKTPIKLGKMKPASFYRIFWGDNYSVMQSTDPAVGTKKMSVLMPFYYCEDAFSGTYENVDGYGFYKDNDHQYTMSYPEVRVGVCHDFVDEVFGIDERDFRLCLDRSIGIPMYKQLVERTENVPVNRYITPDSHTEQTIQANIQVNAVRYDKNSDGRVIVTYNNEVGARFLPNKAGVLALPREVGFLFPHDRVQPIILSFNAVKDGSDPLAIDLVTSGNYHVSTQLDGSCGHSLVIYQAKGFDNNRDSISRTAAIQQSFKTIYADRTNEVVDQNLTVINATGVAPALSLIAVAGTSGSSAAFSDVTNVHPYYALNGDTPIAIEGNDSFISLSRVLWTLMNRFFMPVNVFENCCTKVGSKDDTSLPGVLVDPMEACFMFGLCGFFASDFSQDVLNRADIIDELNIDYTEDEFIKSSLIFRAN